MTILFLQEKLSATFQSIQYQVSAEEESSQCVGLQVGEQECSRLSDLLFYLA